MNTKNSWELERQKELNRKIVLVFDTSVTGCAIAISDGNNVWQEHMETDRGQAEFLVPMINKVIRAAGHSYNAFDRIGVTIGPGSFTGVRVGLSTAKALALAINKPLLGFDTLNVIAQSNVIESETLVLIDTKRGDYYGQVFLSGGERKTPPEIWSQEKVDACGIRVIKDAVPDVEVLARMTLQSENNETSYNPEKAPSPLYLRGAEISQSKRIIPKIVKSA